MNETVKTIVGVAGAAILPTIEEQKAAYIAKLQAEIASTGSFWVRLRNEILIATVKVASDALTQKMLSSLGQ